MSQRRQKKQLSILDNVNSLSDQELREALKGYSQSPGPITDSTRNIYRKKLASLMEVGDGEFEVQPTKETSLLLDPPPDDDDDDTSDEDYNVHEEESEESEGVLEYEETDPEDTEDSSGEDIKLSSTTQLSESAIHPKSAETSANRVSKLIMIFTTLFFLALFSVYVGSQIIGQSSPSLKNLTRQMLTLLVMSPFFFVIYKTFGFFKQRRNIEAQRVCEKVKEALELLQSPDNPKSMMPILHIRDTLLTPSERKDKYMMSIWTKTVKFIEDHESRVKKEMVSIDGEDFRAWKWIGSKKV